MVQGGGRWARALARESARLDAPAEDGKGGDCQQRGQGGRTRGPGGQGLCVPLQPLQLLQQPALLQLWAHLLADGLVVAVQVLELQREGGLRASAGQAVTRGPLDGIPAAYPGAQPPSGHRHSLGAFQWQFATVTI